MKKLLGLILTVGAVLSLTTVAFAMESGDAKVFEDISVSEATSSKVSTPNCVRHNWVYDHTVWKDVKTNGNIVVEQYDWYVCSECGREMYKRIQ